MFPKSLHWSRKVKCYVKWCDCPVKDLVYTKSKDRSPTCLCLHISGVFQGRKSEVLPYRTAFFLASRVHPYLRVCSLTRSLHPSVCIVSALLTPLLWLLTSFWLCLSPTHAHTHSHRCRQASAEQANLLKHYRAAGNLPRPHKVGQRGHRGLRGPTQAHRD